MKRSKRILLMILICFLIFPCALAADIIQVGPSDFMPGYIRWGDWRIHEENTGWCIYLDGDTPNGYCYYQFKQLPHNGTLDQLRIYYFDNDEESLWVRLRRKDIDSGLSTDLAFWQSSGSVNAVRVVDIETFSQPTIKAKGYQYFLELRFSAYSIAGSVRLHSIRLRYYGGE